MKRGAVSGNSGAVGKRTQRVQPWEVVVGIVLVLIAYFVFKFLLDKRAEDREELYGATEATAPSIPIDAIIGDDRFNDGGAMSAVSACRSAVQEQSGYPAGLSFSSIAWSGPGDRGDGSEPWIVSGEYTAPDTEGPELFRCAVRTDPTTTEMTATVVVP